MRLYTVKKGDAPLPVIKNTTKKPLNIRLPGGKRLFLGPGKEGKIGAKADEHPTVVAHIARLLKRRGKKVLVVDAWNWDAPKTKDAKAALAALGAEGRVLVVLNQGDGVAARSFRNLPEVQLIDSRELNAYDVLVNDVVVFTKANLPSTVAAAQEDSK